MRYYSLSTERNDAYGLAIAPVGVTFRLLYERRPVDHWRPPAFVLEDGVFADYQMNDLGWHLCSNKLRLCIDEMRSEDDVIQWLPSTIRGASAEERDYFILHISHPVRILSKTRTVYSGDALVKPVLDLSLVGKRSVFGVPEDSVRVYVSECVREAILCRKFTGVTFLKVPTVVSA